MLDLNLLLVFEAILQTQNVTAAAARNGLTQSAMSNALGRLRLHFDDPLFVSTRSGMLPTPRAHDLAPSLLEALALVRACTQKTKTFDPAQSKRTFRIHMTDVGEMVFLPLLVKHLDAMGATVRIETTQLASADVAERLESGEIDLAVGYLPSLSKNVENLPLFREHYVCMTRQSHPFNRNGGMTLKKFLDGSHVLIESMGSGHRVIERKLVEHGIRRDVALRVPHFLVIPMVVANTDRIVTIPNRVATTFATLVKVRLHPLPFDIPSFDVAVYWHPRFREDPPLQWLRGLFVELFQEPRKGREARA